MPDYGQFLWRKLGMTAGIGHKDLTMKYSLENAHVAVIGLGYVGMPLALALAKYGKVVGFDIHQARIDGLKAGFDSNHEISADSLQKTSCVFSSDPADIKAANVYIVTVPTPIDEHNNPDLTAVRNATKMVGSVLEKGDVVVYESTVYPGVTEDICAPILEKQSGLKSGTGFFLGYSPERINPGDTQHTVDRITKIVAGQNPEITDFLAALYGRMNGGNIFKARDIKTAEAAKAIENAQRDINIAFINEVTMLLNKMGLSSLDVLEAARTKWNFLPFIPGLVGGHCIGVDPYYLAKAALDIGHTPEVILAGRRINDSMGPYVASRVKGFLKEARGFDAEAANVLLLGFTFKENINDIRNSKVIDVVKTLKAFGHNVDVHDPHAVSHDVKEEYGIEILSTLPHSKKYDCVVLTVGHAMYAKMGPADIVPLLKTNDNFSPIVYDIKGLWKTLEFPHNVSYKCI